MARCVESPLWPLMARKARAAAAPMPRVPPVTSTALSRKSNLTVDMMLSLAPLPQGAGGNGEVLGVDAGGLVAAEEGGDGADLLGLDDALARIGGRDARDIFFLAALVAFGRQPA